jgi:hypothetical protein
MKRKFNLTLAAIMCCMLGTMAQSNNDLIVNAGAVENIKIASDMNVVLLPAGENAGLITMDAQAFEKVDMQLAGNTMTVSNRSDQKKSAQTVYLYVGKLKTLTVENNCVVRTVGVLDAPKLDVFVDAHSRVHVKTNGSVKAHALTGNEINVHWLSENLVAKK